MCKGPEVGVWLVCLEMSREVRMSGAERSRGRMVGTEIRSGHGRGEADHEGPCR